MFLETIRVFAMSILSYVDGLEGISEVEREAMRRKWQTPQEDDDSDEGEDPYAWIGRPWNEDGLLDQRAKSPPRDASGNLIGILPRLRSEFEVLVDETGDHLKDKFKDGLEGKCDEGAEIVSIHQVIDRFIPDLELGCQICAGDQRQVCSGSSLANVSRQYVLFVLFAQGLIFWSQLFAVRARSVRT
jgi:hypothetical protein